MKWTRKVVFLWTWVVIFGLLFVLASQNTLTGGAIIDNSLGNSVRARSVSTVIIEDHDVANVYTNDVNPDHVFVFIELLDNSGEMTPLLEDVSVLLFRAYPDDHETIFLYKNYDIFGEANYNRDKGTLDIKSY
jgi:hypothetical protein